MNWRNNFVIFFELRYRFVRSDKSKAYHPKVKNAAAGVSKQLFVYKLL